MRVEILGSGGAVAVPRPGYHNRYNDEARERGVPWQRRGPAVFFHDANILFDTPEDVAESLNRAEIDTVRACFYSHWHPDHVMGRRVFEQMNWNLRGGESRCTDVYVPERVRQDMKKYLGTWSHLDYMESLGIVKLHVIAPGTSVVIDGFTITPLPLAEEYVFAYLIERDSTRIWIAMDELVGWQPDEALKGLDLAVLPSGVCEFHPLTGARNIPADEPVLQSEMRFERTLECIRELAPRHAVLIHLDEPDGVTYDDGLVLSAKYRADGLPITFGWDGLIVDTNQPG